jgi:hypothetical protein
MGKENFLFCGKDRSLQDMTSLDSWLELEQDELAMALEPDGVNIISDKASDEEKQRSKLSTVLPPLLDLAF